MIDADGWLFKNETTNETAWRMMTQYDMDDQNTLNKTAFAYMLSVQAPYLVQRYRKKDEEMCKNCLEKPVAALNTMFMNLDYADSSVGTIHAEELYYDMLD